MCLPLGNLELASSLTEHIHQSNSSEAKLSHHYDFDAEGASVVSSCPILALSEKLPKHHIRLYQVPASGNSQSVLQNLSVL